MLLREAPIRSTNPIATQFVALGAANFGDALDLIASLPYGRNSDRADPSLVLNERKGTCSTKRALLAQLARELDLDVRLNLGIYEMREENTPGVEQPARCREDVARLVATDRWIMDGDFSDTFDLRFPRADAVIDLAYGRYRCMFQAMKRLAFALPEGRNDLPVGCRESFDASNLKWIWSYPITNRPRIDEAVKKWGSHLLYLKFTSPRQLRRWLEDTISC